MSKTTPYFLFDGNCAEAMTFYQQCLGGELTLTKVSESPMKSQFPDELQDKIVHARLTNADGVDVVASDWLIQTRERKPGNTVCAYLSEIDSDTAHAYFDKLSESSDPNLLDSLRDTPFGGYGALTDKFGVRWMFQVNPK